HMVPGVIVAHIPWAGISCLPAPWMVLDRRTHEGYEMFEVGFKARKVFIQPADRPFLTFYSPCERVGDKIVCSAAARTNNWDSARCCFQDRHTESFRTIRGHVNVRS